MRFKCFMQLVFRLFITKFILLQIIGPHDIGIAQSILNNLEPRVHDTSDVLKSGLCIDRTEEMKIGYFNSLSNLLTTTIWQVFD